MAKISVNTGEVNRNVRQISTAGNALAGKQDGLRHPNSSINTPTPKKIREKYTQINNLLHKYGALVKNDAKRIEKVAQNMRELDEKMGRR
ncbi:MULTISPECIES: TIGR04197 family type VII secretion effector [Ligilactobacillus]|mgnify:FL=1|jgi:type VII secretion effector (TIGR04197 family)|uniref:TIGR04197 family type VII secretion effector n=2 Tax=Ligilactobacillus murinus TaxID=1622 RepID=A0A4S2EAC1_9LACO|nr:MULTISPECIES: TIGR04197 family type VII secretion effector [Ligilactobacillus]HAB49839.1 TIGR04197 family type VII secretion effector [Lactobacillus sp.]KRM73231.1 hypothetical protein FC48_GL001124 [Ligilactobacillus murinus DSM 20452 = NBRC 14221]MCR1881251.1 YwqI/YxiC family protein [Ligilactobacillus murinus]MCR1891832.1 YwqI/YxiC family protein [Ligilactobacillus murinus]MCR1896471.1 YwqI/YxiC family protein [Ligilactobacillus murinus]